MSKNKSYIARDSNIELLRILCMFMIVLRHFVIHPLDGNSIIATSLGGKTIDALCYVGVNCFVLISGWFGIKFSWKGLARLYIICAFYGTFAYLFHLYNDGATIGKSFIFSLFFPLSHSNWWFINAYLILFLGAPIINLAASHLQGNVDLLILLLLSIMNVYFGNFWQTPLFSDSGYDAAHMVFIYWIGICLRKRVSFDWLKRKRLVLFTSYLLCSFIWLFLVIVTRKYELKFIHLGYNNIFTIIASICLFLFFVSFQFKNVTINRIAISSLAVYLVQEQPYLGPGFLYPMVGRLLSSSVSLGHQMLLVFLLSSVFFIAVVLLDQLRLVFSNALIKMIPNKEVSI